MNDHQTAESLPMVLKAGDIAKILGVAVSTAYALMRREDFPLIEGIGNKRCRRDAFFKWLESKERNFLNTAENG